MDRGKGRFSKSMTSNVVDRQKRFENAVCGRGFLRKREEKISVFKKNPDTCGWDLAINDRVQLSFVFFFN